MNAFHHFRTNERTTCYDTVKGNHFTEMVGSKGTGVDVMVTEGAFEADIEDCVVVDVGMLNAAKGHCSFFQSPIERRKELCWFGEDTACQSNT